MRKLIINADDYGYAQQFNDGILDASLLTSTTVMIKRPFVDLRLLEKNIGVGLHLELNKKLGAYEQTEEQYIEFIEVFGLPPTHLDSHKWLHEEKELFEGVTKFAVEHGLPMRSTKPELRKYFESRGILTPNNYFHSFDWEGIERKSKTLEILEALPEGITEWAVHPGYFDEESETSKNKEREEELALCNDIKIRELIEEKGIELVSYADAF